MTPPLVPYRGRFAPSPTGPLHFGSLVAAVGSYLDARNRGGEWLVRMEDIDTPRNQPGASDDILHTLELYGFQWDGAVMFQSDRREAYADALSTLMRSDLTYECACSRKSLAAIAKRGAEGLIYPGTCRNRRPAGRKNRAVRLLTPDDPIQFQDRIAGVVGQNIAREIGDFIIRRADGIFAYQLAVVIDDACQQITDIVRGADLLISTPRQIWLQRLLQLPTPRYAHLPLVLNANGQKLSKQNGAKAISSDNPLPELMQSLRFLGQTLPEEPPGDVDTFWQWAVANWEVDRVSAP